MPAVPVVKALLIEDALRKDCEPSIPTTDPLMVLLTGPRLNTNSLLKVSLKQIRRSVNQLATDYMPSPAILCHNYKIKYLHIITFLGM